MTNLERLQQAYKLWHETKGGSPKGWLELFAENVSIQSMGSEARPLAFAQTRKSKAEAIEYFSSLALDWSMNHWSPHTFVSEGSRIAVFSTCSWTHKRTGKPVETAVAHLWQFEGDKVVSLQELFDSARVVAAAAP